MIEISIYIDGRYHHMRKWPGVPRVGEEIMVARERDGVLDDHAIVIVDTVCWGTSSASREHPWSELRVSLSCHWG